MPAGGTTRLHRLRRRRPAGLSLIQRHNLHLRNPPQRNRPKPQPQGRRRPGGGPRHACLDTFGAVAAVRCRADLACIGARRLPSSNASPRSSSRPAPANKWSSTLPRFSESKGFLRGRQKLFQIKPSEPEPCPSPGNSGASSAAAPAPQRRPRQPEVRHHPPVPAWPSPPPTPAASRRIFLPILPSAAKFEPPNEPAHPQAAPAAPAAATRACRRCPGGRTGRCRSPPAPVLFPFLPQQ